MAKDLIQSKFDPKIDLVRLTTSDDSNGSDSILKMGKNQGSQKEQSGASEPFVKINSVIITGIDELIIDETGLIPTIKLSFNDKDGSISGPNYPKHDSIVSIFIKNPTEKFKPIRCDFLITNIKTINDYGNKAGSDNFIVISGELFIPKLYNNISKSYSNLTSKSVLEKIAEDSDLGFASNDFTTNDTMTWINTNDSQLDFIKEVTRHSYIDDDTYFNSFIDKYYYLTFINVPEQLNPKNPIRETFASTIELDQLDSKQWLLDDSQKQEFTESRVPILLTNDPGSSKSPNYILNYKLMGDSGKSLRTKGYKRKVYYYDHSLQDNQFTSFYMKPASIKGTGPNPEAGITPNNEYLKSNEIKKWMGIQYSNVHTEWNASVLINDHNNTELNKIKLHVTTPGINYSVLRGSSLPVGIFIPSDRNVIQNSHRNDLPDGAIDSASPYKYDRDIILSGRYYVSGIRYIYDKTEDYKFRTEFELARTNWYNENNLI